MESKPRGTALITGASSGLGAALAHEIARRGRDVVLTARREDRLHAVAERIEATTARRARILPGDLADPATPDRLRDALRDVEIDLLVNNAGFGVPGRLTATDWARQRDCLEVMTAAPVRLCRLFAADMELRGRGAILNVASLAAFVPPHAGGTLYYPVKAFLLQFSLALREELRGAGVSVTALCPGFVETEFQAAAGGSVESVTMPRLLWMTAPRVAEIALSAAERGDAICVPGRIDRLIATAFKLMPGALGRWIVRGES